MSQSITNRLINKLIDWLIAFSIASFLLWFVLTQPVLKNTEALDIQAVDQIKLKQHVEFLTKGFAPRTINYDNLNHTADYIYRQFSEVGLPDYQAIQTISKSYRNVLLQLGPDTEELFVIGAHYDAENDSIDTEGNASGVATLIELARHLAENNHRLDIGVVLVAYPISLNQTDNLVNTGSYHHALSLKENNKKVRLMISLDSVGQIKSDSKGRSARLTDLFYSNSGQSLNIVGRLKDVGRIRELKKSFNPTKSLSLHSQNLLENFTKTDSSDHINYWNQGYSAVLMSDILNSQKTTRDENKFEPKDRLDYEKLADLVNGLFQVVVQTRVGDEDRTRLAQRARNKKSKSLF